MSYDSLLGCSVTLHLNVPRTVLTACPDKGMPLRASPLSPGSGACISEGIVWGKSLWGATGSGEAGVWDRANGTASRALGVRRMLSGPLVKFLHLCSPRKWHGDYESTRLTAEPSRVMQSWAQPVHSVLAAAEASPRKDTVQAACHSWPCKPRRLCIHVQCLGSLST